MTLKLMYITNNVEIAKIAQASGVDRIFVDLEVLGKDERQGKLDTVRSSHNISDIKKIKDVLSKSELFVRTNPIYCGSKHEIDKVIEAGADIVMLPMFKTTEEVTTFINFVDKRARTCLLLETEEAENIIDEILKINGIDEMFIGLNDLHLSHKMKFMFELLADGTVDRLSKKIKNKGMPFGFGGISRLGLGVLPADNIVVEHYRLGSSMVILSRGFCNADKIKDLNKIKNIFNESVKKLREFEQKLILKEPKYFLENHKYVIKKVNEILTQI